MVLQISLAGKGLNEGTFHNASVARSLLFSFVASHVCMQLLLLAVNPTPKMAGGHAETPSEFETFARGEYPMILEQPMEEESKQNSACVALTEGFEPSCTETERESERERQRERVRVCVCVCVRVCVCVCVHVCV